MQMQMQMKMNMKQKSREKTTEEMRAYTRYNFYCSYFKCFRRRKLKKKSLVHLQTSGCICIFFLDSFKWPF